MVKVYMSFMMVRSWFDLLCFCSVLCLLCLCARLFMCALWSPAGKGLTSWLSFVVSNCEFVTFPLVSWVGCGTWLYRLLIFAPLLTLKLHCYLHMGQRFLLPRWYQVSWNHCQARDVLRYQWEYGSWLTATPVDTRLFLSAGYRKILRRDRCYLGPWSSSWFSSTNTPKNKWVWPGNATIKHCRPTTRWRGGGGSLIFSYIRRLGSFFMVQIFEHQYFWGFSEKLIFLGVWKFCRYFFGVIQKLD